MRRRDHPSFPSAITCCFLSLLKTLLMPSEPIRALSGVNVPGFPMAGFQPTLYGRIRVTPEVEVPTPEPTSSPRCRYCKIGTKVLSRASQKETEREPPIYGHGFSSKQYRSPTVRSGRQPFESDGQTFGPIPSPGTTIAAAGSSPPSQSQTPVATYVRNIGVRVIYRSCFAISSARSEAHLPTGRLSH